VFSCKQIADETKIKSEKFGLAAETTKSRMSLDLSGKYLSNLMREMLTGLFILRHRETGYNLEKGYRHSEKMIQ
jgi:hypothetical protein